MDRAVHLLKEAQTGSLERLIRLHRELAGSRGGFRHRGPSAGPSGTGTRAGKSITKPARVL